MQPFGEVACEAELMLLKDKYSEYFFEEAPFNKPALAIDSYLIVGRRGSGKTSLAQYFGFQQKIPGTHAIYADKPEIYQSVLLELVEKAAPTLDLSIHKLVKIWDYILWSLIFNELHGKHPTIDSACVHGQGKVGTTELILALIKSFLEKTIGEQGARLITNQLERVLNRPVIEEAKNIVFGLTKDTPIILAIDSLEHYDAQNASMMAAMAALIQCASDFNLSYSHHGIHLKVFITSEIFPHLKENYLSNTLKHLRNPIYLHWRPKDLVRLVSWRLYHYLTNNRITTKKNIEWSNFDSVLKEMWSPYFGDDIQVSITGMRETIKVQEKTFPYVLRHIQLRPRQLIVICNRAAKLSIDEGTFPRISHISLHHAVQDGSIELAEEIINSYSRIYKNLSQIIDVLRGSPIHFKGSHLDALAPKTAKFWEGNYSSYKFISVLSELGVIGRARNIDDKSKIIQADFEYFKTNRLSIQDGDDCVIHPMFHRTLNINPDNYFRVMPFPDAPEFDSIS